MASRKNQKAIGKGWYQLQDKKGRTYYANVKTKESSWKWPADVEPPAAPPTVRTADISTHALRRDHTKFANRRRIVHDVFHAPPPESPEATSASRKADRILFATEFFAVSKGGLFSKKDDVASLLRWSSKPLKKPLLKALREHGGKACVEDALQFMRNIQGCMLDRKTGKSPVGHVQKLMATALKYVYYVPKKETSPKKANKTTQIKVSQLNSGCGIATETNGVLMWDELYLQLMKQTHNAPALSSEPGALSSLHRGWKLLHCVAGILKPSDALLPLVLHHCDAGMEEGGVAVTKLSKQTKETLLRTRRLQCRTQVPTGPELHAALRGQPMMQRIFTLPDDSGMLHPVLVPVHSWMSAAQVTRVVAATLGVVDERPFALFNATPKHNELEAEGVYGPDDSAGYHYSVIPSDRALLDVVGEWQARIESDLKAKKGKSQIKTGARLEHIVFCVRYFIPPLTKNNTRDDVGDQLIFMQALHEVRSDRWKFKQSVRRKEYYELATLQILAQSRGASPLAELHLQLDDLMRFLPPHLRDADSLAGICEKYKELSETATGGGSGGRKWYESRDDYIELVKQWDLFGMTQFAVESKGSTIISDGKFLLAVCPHIVNIIDARSLSIVKQLPYQPLYAVEGPSKTHQLTLRFQMEATPGRPFVLKLITGGAVEGNDLKAMLLIYKNHEGGAVHSR